ncbi:unnamed protein product [Lactuca saligna]|uniref:Ribosomal protein L34e superfamily protein n=1 Tax=Lactuca saligna TaxID=75948 RepID=A0AA36DZ83_LACSI|nr:unnamed protein product [Lactuca saligna]
MVDSRGSIPVEMVKFEQSNQSKKIPISACEQSRSAFIDLIILIAVIGACGFLIHPYVSLLLSKTLETLTPIMIVIQQELMTAPMIYMCLGLTILTTSMAVLAMTLCTNPKCGKPGCRGLSNGAAFDIQIETEESIKNSNSNSNSNSSSVRCGLKTGLFELPRDYHRELEAELKKMAPANGRVILVFRSRCGCSVGRMEVHGPKKSNRKIKR